MYWYVTLKWLSNMAKDNLIWCYCLNDRGNRHCPLTTDKADLERTFNYQVRNESIEKIGIDPAFKCTDERKDYCKNCPFK